MLVKISYMIIIELIKLLNTNREKHIEGLKSRRRDVSGCARWLVDGLILTFFYLGSRKKSMHACVTLLCLVVVGQHSKLA